VAPRPVRTGLENLAPTGIRTPDAPARSQSLTRTGTTEVQAHKSVPVALVSKAEPASQRRQAADQPPDRSLSVWTHQCPNRSNDPSQCGPTSAPTARPIPLNVDPPVPQPLERSLSVWTHQCPTPRGPTSAPHHVSRRRLTVTFRDTQSSSMTSVHPPFPATSSITTNKVFNNTCVPPGTNVLRCVVVWCLFGSRHVTSRHVTSQA
jgi:hypothetical protein